MPTARSGARRTRTTHTHTHTHTRSVSQQRLLLRALECPSCSDSEEHACQLITGKYDIGHGQMSPQQSRRAICSAGAKKDQHRAQVPTTASAGKIACVHDDLGKHRVDVGFAPTHEDPNTAGVRRCIEVARGLRAGKRGGGCRASPGWRTSFASTVAHSPRTQSSSWASCSTTWSGDMHAALVAVATAFASLAFMSPGWGGPHRPNPTNGLPHRQSTWAFVRCLISAPYPARPCYNRMCRL